MKRRGWSFPPIAQSFRGVITRRSHLIVAFSSPQRLGPAFGAASAVVMAVKGSGVVTAVNPVQTGQVSKII